MSVIGLARHLSLSVVLPVSELTNKTLASAMRLALHVALSIVPLVSQVDGRKPVVFSIRFARHLYLSVVRLVPRYCNAKSQLSYRIYTD